MRIRVLALTCATSAFISLSAPTEDSLPPIHLGTKPSEVILAKITVSDVRNHGGQGRNRTADASLFRAGSSHAHLIESAKVIRHSRHFFRPFIGTVMEQLLEQVQFTKADPANVVKRSTTRLCDSGTNCW